MKDENLLGLSTYKNISERIEFLEKKLKVKAKYLNHLAFSEEQVTNKNIENLVGAVQIPLGIAGPILINDQVYYLPLATTEGALVASVSRGAKAVTLSQGVSAFTEYAGISRGPVFKAKNLKHAFAAKKWFENNFGLLKKASEETSDHIILKKIDISISGRNLFARFVYDTDQAMGMNMVTIATTVISQIIEKETLLKLISIAGNFDVDKKAAWLNIIEGRGRQVWAEAIIKKQIVKEVLKTTTYKIVEVVTRKDLIGSAMSGSMGFNAHFANVVAAMFLATGQDPAHIVEGSLGITNAEKLPNGDLYFAVYLPAVCIGTIGGGTGLPAQKNAMELLKLTKENKTEELATILGGAILAGELSLTASLAQNSLARAHLKLGRGAKE